MAGKVGFFVLVAVLLGLPAGGAFVVPSKRMAIFAAPAAPATARPQLLKIPSTLRASLVDRAADLDDGQKASDSIATTGRRSFLVGTMAAATAAAGISSTNLPFLGSSSSNAHTLSTVAEVIQWIDDHCDRRFLHAVVASDYRFLYRGVAAGDGSANKISIRSEEPDLLRPETYGPEALPFFQKVEELLQDEAVKPSNGHLATTSARDAAAWGTAASIWPMRGAHYAWFQNGGLFYPRANNDASPLDRKSIIVDGRDCGKDSLEDALRGESWEIMVATPSFLAVPISRENELRERLRNSFLV